MPTTACNMLACPTYLSAFTRLGACVTAAPIAFDDHRNDKRFGDRIETVTANSALTWRARPALAAPVQVLR